MRPVRAGHGKPARQGLIASLGCSDLLVEIFGEPGRHARSAIGVAELPFTIAVEIEMTARLHT
jgi:enamine deaminase RidA (YjgF/YER057c/UK114 family)